MSDGGWSFGGSILTFVFPMILFIGVAAALYVLYTKPAAVPGRRSSSTAEHPVSYTPIPGAMPAAEVPAAEVPGSEVPGSEVPADGEGAAPEARE